MKKYIALLLTIISLGFGLADSKIASAASCIVYQPMTPLPSWGCGRFRNQGGTWVEFAAQDTLNDNSCVHVYVRLASNGSWVATGNKECNGNVLSGRAMYTVNGRFAALNGLRIYRFSATHGNNYQTLATW